jgi:hypothetical protein
MFKRLLVVLMLVVSLVPFAEAQRRRAVRSPGGGAPQNGNCHTFALVRAGLVAGYRSVAPGGTVTFQVTYISDTPTQTKTTQKVQAPTGNADVETTLDGEIVGNLRGLKHIEIKTTMTVPVLGSVSGTTDIDFVPSLLAGPAAGWCVGETWTISPVTETVITTGFASAPPIIVTTIASTGEVLAVGENVTVPAGTFRTVKYRSSVVSGTSVQPAITWTSMDHSIVVKQDTLDASGNVTSSTELTSLQ